MEPTSKLDDRLSRSEGDEGGHPTDAFLGRASEQLNRLKVDKARLLDQEADLRRRRQEIEHEIDDLEASLDVYRRVMGVRRERQADTAPPESEGKSIAEIAEALMVERGGSIRVADLVSELPRLRGIDSVPAYATVYTALNRNKRFAKAGPGEFRIQPTDEEVTEEVARRQLQFQPPRAFVGLNFLANELGWHGKLDDLIKRGLLVRYSVDNPKNPDFPTTAIRVATDVPEARAMLPNDLLEDLDNLDYGRAG
jgi:hypothetical protein